MAEEPVLFEDYFDDLISSEPDELDVDEIESPTQFIVEKFSSQQITTIKDFMEIIKHKDFLFQQPRHAEYINRLLEEKFHLKPEEREEFLLKEIKKIDRVYWPDDRPDYTAKAWLGLKPSPDKEPPQSIRDKEAPFMLCFILHLKPLGGKNKNFGSCKTVAQEEETKRAFRENPTYKSAEGFLSEAFSVNAFNGRDVRHVVYEYCLVHEGITYSQARQLADLCLAELQKFSNQLNTGKITKEDIGHDFTEIVHNDVAGAEKLIIGANSFKKLILKYLADFQQQSLTAINYYFDYKNRVIIHLINKEKRRENRGQKSIFYDRNKIVDAIDAFINEYRDELGVGYEVAGWDNLGSTWELEKAMDVIQTYRFGELVEEHRENEKSSKTTKKHKEYGPLDVYDIQLKIHTILSTIVPNTELPHALVSRYAQWYDGDRVDFRREEIERITGSKLVKQFAEGLPTRSLLNKLERQIVDEKQEFHEVPNGRNFLVLFYFYDYVYNIIEGKLTFEDKPGDFLFYFTDRMLECGLAVPFLRSLFDSTLLGCIAAIANQDPQTVEPEKVFDQLIKEMVDYEKNGLPTSQSLLA